MIGIDINDPFLRGGAFGYLTVGAYFRYVNGVTEDTLIFIVFGALVLLISYGMAYLTMIKKERRESDLEIMRDYQR